MNWTVVLLAVIVILLAIMGILQVLWIRKRLTQVQDVHKLNVVLNNNDKSDGVGNTLQVYSMLVDGDITALMNDPSLKFYRQFRDTLNEEVYNTAYVCNAGVRSGNMILKKAGFMAVFPTNGSNSLADDIKHRRVQYLMIGGKMFFPMFDDKVSQRLVQMFADSNLSGDVTARVQSDDIFILYAVKSAANSDLDVADDSSCQVSIQSLFGPVSTMTNDTGDYIDVNKELNIPSQKKYPVHAMGYRL